MKNLFKNAEFVFGVTSYRNLPDDNGNEILLAGRSNAGKSSALNVLTDNSKLARISKTPGRTTEINFFKVNDDLMLLDLPRYGYAKSSKAKKKDWGPLLGEYFQKRKALSAVVIFMDIRHPLKESDWEMIHLCRNYNIPFIPTLAKSDKLSNNNIAKAIAFIKEKIPLMLEYQNQNCDLTLQEGLECYYKAFPETTEIFEDNNDSGTLLRDHDCTHVIFGLDISIEQESILDTWVVWGSKWKLKYIWGYQSLPQIKQLYKDLFKEFGILGFLKIFWKLGGIKRKAMFRAFKMKKKWPFKMPEEYLSMKISDLREEYGIKILLPEELKYIPIER